MAYRPSVLCPIDFSEPSRVALRYAAAIAEHFGATLTLLAVDDPLLAGAVRASGDDASLTDETERELHRFTAAALPPLPAHPAATIEYTAVIGNPAPEILRHALDREADLIVMGSHGRSGARKLFFGSTAERVLRETTVPVLVTPLHAEPVLSLEDIGRQVRRILAPVDLSPGSGHQVALAAGLAAGLGVPLLLVYVLEPVFVPTRLRNVVPGIDFARRTECEERLAELAAACPAGVTVETIVVAGDPSEEVVKLAAVRQAHLIVMGLHSSAPLGRRMGSVTYRVLCLAQGLVLALPPANAVEGSQRPGVSALVRRLVSGRETNLAS